ncbi:MAG: hypothetical protein HQL45_17740 [Alphaproteobacteria bacterium]|nr:hypothetical protein [Alphaproteobacteria bacterium]
MSQEMAKRIEAAGKPKAEKKPPSKRGGGASKSKLPEKISASLREQEALVRHLFEAFGKLKKRRKKNAPLPEIFSSQDPSRVSPQPKTSAQVAFERASLKDRLAMLEALSAASPTP